MKGTGTDDNAIIGVFVHHEAFLVVSPSPEYDLPVSQQHLPSGMHALGNTAPSRYFFRSIPPSKAGVSLANSNLSTFAILMLGSFWHCRLSAVLSTALLRSAIAGRSRS